MTDAFDSRFLREFLIIAQEDSLRRAAARMNIAPSALSRKLAEVERSLGVALLERSAQGIALTDAGRLLREHALTQQDEQTFLLEQLGRFRDTGGPPVRIVIGEGFAADLMENGIARIALDHPGLRFRIDLAGTGEIQRRVAEGEADLGIAYSPASSAALRSVCWARQPLCAILPVDGPLARQPRLGLADILAGPVAMLDSRHAIRVLVAQAAGDQGLALDPQIETSSIAALIRYVSAGLGATFLPRFSAAIQAARGELVIVDLDEECLQSVSAHLLVRARRRLPASVALAAEQLARGMVAFRT